MLCCFAKCCTLAVPTSLEPMRTTCNVRNKGEGGIIYIGPVIIWGSDNDFMLQDSTAVTRVWAFGSFGMAQILPLLQQKVYLGQI